MANLTGKPFIVWVNYGTEGWQPTEADNFDDAVTKRDTCMGNGNYNVVITELVPLRVLDGRVPA